MRYLVRKTFSMKSYGTTGDGQRLHLSIRRCTTTSPFMRERRVSTFLIGSTWCARSPLRGDGKARQSSLHIMTMGIEFLPNTTPKTAGEDRKSTRLNSSH